MLFVKLIFFFIIFFWDEDMIGIQNNKCMAIFIVFILSFFYRLRESTTVNLIVEMDRFCSIIAVLWHFGQWGKWMNNFLSFPVQMQVWYWSLMRAYFARSTFLHQVFMLKNVWPPCQLILHVCVRTTENKQYS